MKTVPALHVLWFCLTLTSALAQNPGMGEIDFTGVDQFWSLAEKLRKNIRPGKKAWKQLFDTPSYSYLANEAGKEVIKNRLITAYAPQMADEREEIRSGNSYPSMIIDHLIGAMANKEHIARYLDSLKGEPLLKNAFVHTQAYLPGHFISKHRELYPQLAFAIFEPDGKANDQIIVVDAAFARTINLELFLAHEAHHFFMGNIRKKMKRAEGGTEFILRALRQLHLEGIADLIDKRGILEMPDTITEAEDWYAYNYKKHYSNARQTFAQIDSLIQEFSATGRVGLGEDVWNSLHFGTHPEALHMALLIENTFGRQHIISLLGNPFEYLRSYQKAARKNPTTGWVFSDVTMAYFEELQSRYLIKPPP